MPSWAIHLKIAKELNKKYHFDEEPFYFGNLLPDTDKEWKEKRFDAHYYGFKKFPKCPGENMIDIDKFITDYGKCIDNPLIIGYYLHLLTDNYYNEYIYYNKWISDNDKVIGYITNKNEKVYNDGTLKENARVKHHDLELYGKYLYKDNKIVFNKSVDKKDLDLLKYKFISTKDVKKRINYLNNEFDAFNKIDEKDDYIILTKEELDNLLENCINYLDSKLEELKRCHDEGKILVRCRE